MHLWFDCLFYLGLWKVVFINWGYRVGCINQGGLSIMEDISANLLGQLDFLWKIERIHLFPNAALLEKCC